MLTKNARQLCFLCLDGAGLFDSVANGCGGFALLGGGEGFVVDKWDFDMEVDAVEEGSADALAVFLDEGWAAAAFAFGVAIVTAGAGIEMTVTLNMIVCEPWKSASLVVIGGIPRVQLPSPPPRCCRS
jgi:hypothetical protein